MHYGKDSLFPASKTKKRRFFATSDAFLPIFARFRAARIEARHCAQWSASNQHHTPKFSCRIEN
jgi:hypothetical protein